MNLVVLRWVVPLALPIFFILAACAPTPSVPTPSPTPFPYDSAATAARREGRPMQALYLVEAAAARDGWTPHRLRLAGDLWQEAGDLPRALDYWTAAAVEPNVVTLRSLALANLDLGRWTAAKDALERLIELAPDNTWAHLELGLIEAAFDPRSAEIHLRAAMLEPGYTQTAVALLDVLTDDPADPLMSMRVGFVLVDLELWRYAELAFDHAAAIAAPFPLAVAYTGFARDQQGKDGGAWFEDAIALDPENAEVRYLYGLHLRHVGDEHASLESFAEAARLDPDNPAFHAELGAAYRLLGDLEAAEAALQTAVEVSSGDDRFRRLLALFYADEVNNLTDGGVEALQAIASALPDDPDVQAGYGWTLYNAGDMEEGRARIDAALEADPDNPRARYYKARILLLEGSPAAARALLDALAGGDSAFAADARALLETIP